MEFLSEEKVRKEPKGKLKFEPHQLKISVEKRQEI